MSHSRTAHKLSDKSRTDIHATDRNVDEGNVICNATDSCTYAVTVSKKSSGSSEEGALCSGQKSFISIHSTDHLCQVTDSDKTSNLEDCNLEVISLNEVFPSTSEESVSNEDESPAQRKKKNKSAIQKSEPANAERSSYMPSNSKSMTGSRRGQEETVDGQQASVYSDFNIPKNTLYVVGSNPGEPKMSYPDPPKKLSKTMKKFLRNIDKHKNDQNNKSNEKPISKLTTMRGILKDGRCGLECTGDSSMQDVDEYNTEDLTFTMDFDPRNYSKQSQDKNVTFNTQVLIIHYTGGLCVGQSVETLSKEKDQQARNSELRKTFLTKYNEFWPTQK